MAKHWLEKATTLLLCFSAWEWGWTVCAGEALVHSSMPLALVMSEWTGGNRF